MRNYTTKELNFIENTIKKNIKLFPTNLANSFEVSSEEISENLSRRFSKKSASNFYYKKLKPAISSETTDITVVSKNGTFSIGNVKNSIRQNQNSLTQDEKFDIIKEMVVKMNRVQKKKIIEIIFNL